MELTKIEIQFILGLLEKISVTGTENMKVVLILKQKLTKKVNGK